ncbi:diguanylate cyclase [Mesorhizobium sp. Root157]|uniref:GGDEF domain-containing protein n=1 Tax=Mesorhizobium sp. Root157 TaxID=1736477 RepID=UPI0006FE4E43|nr:GGDEF domain-containing protein [Mesorhizobium sp. Root157]KRA00179.1 diguanylate cyclase [Mesorhizobium sp. Root157]
MTSANFILAINVFVAALLAASFMVLAAGGARRTAAHWLAFSYMLGIGYLLIEFSIPVFRDAHLPVTVAFAVFLAATIAFNVGLAHNYNLRQHWQLMLFFLAAATFVVYLVQDQPRQALTRMMAYQLPYAAMQAVALAIVWSSKKRPGALDRLLMVVLALSVLQFASKPFLAHALGGWGANPQSYLQSSYAMVSQTMGTIFTLAIALLMLGILVRDALAEATFKSEADALSRLLNRGGFQAHAGLALRTARKQGIPVSLVLADLDHFKTINDSFGHASGDRVIEAFAGFLRGTVTHHHIVGRIGGEEFAILLPGTNLTSARLFAEGIRSAFSALPIEGLPKTHRCTASFGAAELQLEEGLADLMRRADEALYGAKKAGRDQVRVSGGPLSLVQPPAEPPGWNFNGKG